MQSSNYLSHIIYAFLCLSLSTQLQAATKTWNGNTNSDWKEAANWTPAGEPQNEDDVIIPDSTSTAYKPAIDAATNYINSLVLQNRASLQISETGTLWLFMDPAGDPPYPPPPTKIHIQANAKIHLYGEIAASLAPKIVIDASGTLNNWGKISNSFGFSSGGEGPGGEISNYGTLNNWGKIRLFDPNYDDGIKKLRQFQ